MEEAPFSALPASMENQILTLIEPGSAGRGKVEMDVLCRASQRSHLAYGC